MPLHLIPGYCLGALARLAYGVRGRSFLLATLALATLAAPAAAAAQKVPRIGFLASISANSAPARVEAFRLGLRELGWVEGQSVTIEWRWAEGRDDRLLGLAEELVRLKVDVIVTVGATTTHTARRATAVPAGDGLRDPLGARSFLGLLPFRAVPAYLGTLRVGATAYTPDARKSTAHGTR